MSLFRFGFKPVGDRTEADTNISGSVVGGDAGTSDAICVPILKTVA